MKGRRSIKACVTFALAAATGAVPSGAPAAAGIDRPQGEWRGSMVLPEGAEADLRFGFGDMAGRPLATMSIPGREIIGPSDLVLERGGFAFSVRMGDSWLRCELARQANDSYAGHCSDGGSYEGAIHMWPETNPAPP